MVDVNVEREKVDVQQARVAVERQDLANKQEFENAGLKFELEKLRIDAEREVRIEAAVAMGKMLSGAHMQIFGDPETMARMTRQFMNAASYGTATDGLMKSLPPQGAGTAHGVRRQPRAANERRSFQRQVGGPTATPTPESKQTVVVKSRSQCASSAGRNSEVDSQNEPEIIERNLFRSVPDHP